MPVTNYLPSSRLIQPGVCTSTTRPASPFEGQAIFETDTDRMLIWNGSTWVVPNAPAQNPTGLELIYSSDFTAQKNAATTSGVFSSLYNEYKIYLRISDFVGTGVCWLQMGTNDSFETTSSYRYAGFQSYSDSNITGTVQSSGAIGFLMQDLGLNSGVHKHIGTSIDLFNPFESVYTTASNITYAGIDPQYYGRFLFQKLSTSASYNQCRIQFSGTSITGSLRVYGYRK